MPVGLRSLTVVLFTLAVGTFCSQKLHEERSQIYGRLAFPVSRAGLAFAPEGSTAGFKSWRSMVPFQAEAGEGETELSARGMDPDSRQAIPFKLVDGRILVPVRINGDFDDSRQRIFFRKSKFFGQATSFDKSGMWLVQDGEAFSVLEVVPDGAAARAGIEPGDRLMAIDGTKTADILLPAIRERWAKADDTTPVRILAERAGKRREFTVRLKAIQ
jgi:membrane-associated protease RseP (regulator of RpoE activity)